MKVYETITHKVSTSSGKIRKYEVTKCRTKSYKGEDMYHIQVITSNGSLLYRFGARMFTKTKALVRFPDLGGVIV